MAPDSPVPDRLDRRVVEATHDGVRLEIPATLAPLPVGVCVAFVAGTWGLIVSSVWGMVALGDGLAELGSMVGIATCFAIGLTAFAVGQTREVRSLSLAISGVHLSINIARPLGMGRRWSLPLVDLQAAKLHQRTLILDVAGEAPIRIPLPDLSDTARGAITTLLDDAITRAVPRRGDVPDAIQRVVGNARATTEPTAGA